MGSSSSKSDKSKTTSHTQSIIHSVPNTPIYKMSDRELKNLKYRHLVVDDLPLNRVIMMKYLNRIGVTCDQAENGKVAYEIYKKKSVDYYDIIWIDIKMPIMGGYELTQKIRDSGYNNIIIGFTGNISKESRDMCFNCGMDEICSKPISKSDLYSMKWLQCYKKAYDC